MTFTSEHCHERSLVAKSGSSTSERLLHHVMMPLLGGRPIAFLRHLTNSFSWNVNVSLSEQCSEQVAPEILHILSLSAVFRDDRQTIG